MKSLQNCQCEAVLQTWDDHFQFAHARRKRNSVKIAEMRQNYRSKNPGEFVMSPASGATSQYYWYIQNMCDFMRFRGGLEGVTNRIPSAILVMVFMRLLDVLSTGTL